MQDEIYSSPQPCYLSKAAISEFAEDVAKSLGYQPGQALDPIVANLGGKITYQEFWDLDSTEDGSIVIESANRFQITLSEHTSSTRDRFTIAHELGHYFLHYRLPGVKAGQPMAPMKAARYGTGQTEYEANWFAASFLMPEGEFRKNFDIYGGNHLLLAEKFGVSTSASKVRAKALGLDN